MRPFLLPIDSFHKSPERVVSTIRAPMAYAHQWQYDYKTYNYRVADD